MNQPDCIHDGARTHYEVTTQCETILQVTCDECQSLLFERTLNLITLEVTRVYYDDVYENLYTRKGRIKLLSELLIEKGWNNLPIWSENGTR